MAGTESEWQKLTDRDQGARLLEARAEDERRKLNDATRTTQKFIVAGGSTGDAVADLLIGHYGEGLWDEDYDQLETHVQRVIERLSGKSGQPVLIGEYSLRELYDLEFERSFKMTFAYLEGDEVRREVRKTGEELRKTIGLVVPTGKSFRFASQTRHQKNGSKLDDVLEPDEGPLFVQVSQLAHAQTHAEQSSRDATQVVLVGTEPVEKFMEAAGRGLDYFRMAALSGRQVEVPEAAHEQYREACIRFTTDVLSLSQSREVSISEELQLRAKALGFDSIRAAVTYGQGLAERELGLLPAYRG